MTEPKPPLSNADILARIKEKSDRLGDRVVQSVGKETPPVVLPIKIDSAKRKVEESARELLQQLRGKRDSLINRVTEDAKLTSEKKEEYRNKYKKIFDDVHNQVSGKEITDTHLTLLDETLQVLKDEEGQLNKVTSRSSRDRGGEKSPEDENMQLFNELIVILKKRKSPFRSKTLELKIIDVTDTSIGVEYTENGESRSGNVGPKFVKRFIEELKNKFEWNNPIVDWEQRAKRKSGSSASAEEKGDEPKERKFEEMEKVLKKEARNNCIGLIAEGIAFIKDFIKKEKGNRATLQTAVKEYGTEALIQNMIPTVIKALPADWVEGEKRRFAIRFTRNQLKETLED